MLTALGIRGRGKGLHSQPPVLTKILSLINYRRIETRAWNQINDLVEHLVRYVGLPKPETFFRVAGRREVDVCPSKKARAKRVKSCNLYATCNLTVNLDTESIAKPLGKRFVEA